MPAGLRTANIRARVRTRRQYDGFRGICTPLHFPHLSPPAKRDLIVLDGTAGATVCDMLRTHKHASFVLAAVVAVMLVAACCFGGAAAMPGVSGNTNVTGPSLFAPHSTPFSAAGAAASFKLLAMRSGGAAMAPTCSAGTNASAQITVLPVLSVGHSIEPFCLRLRI